MSSSAAVILSCDLLRCSCSCRGQKRLALEKVCLPFWMLRKHLLFARLRRGPGKDLGRLPAEHCWRVMFAYVERARASFGRCRLRDIDGCVRPGKSVWYDT